MRPRSPTALIEAAAVDSYGLVRFADQSDAMGTSMRSNSSRMSGRLIPIMLEGLLSMRSSRHFQRLTLGDIGVQVGGLGPQHAAACDACWLAVFAIR